jgi:DNA-binding FadR family transcriptional regulator
MTLTTATARTLLMPLDGGRAELVARRLGEAIRLGLLADGDRLPPERRLAEQLGVAPVTLREALAMLREEGLVTTRRGRRGGTFVHAPADLGEPLRRFSVQELRDLGDHRRAIAGTAAQLAAERALPEEVGRLREQLERLRAAVLPSDRRRADTQFTIEVAAAAQSPRLTREEARLRAEVGDLLALGRDDHAALVRERVLLVRAIAGRRSARARQLAEKHVVAETARLIELRLGA